MSQKKIKLGVVMDPIQSIHFKKDTTLSLLWEAEKRGWELHYFELEDLFIRDGNAFGHSRLLKVFHNADRWWELSEPETIALADLNIILMRKDPPFNLEYIYATYILELAESMGVVVANKPQSLRDTNEKLFTTHFPQCCPPTLVTRDMSLLRHFLKEQNEIICKPLDAMGGASIFRLHSSDINASVIFETLTQRGSVFMMAQRFIPEISEGDKRILIIDGKPIPFALARIPAPGESRGNLVAGARGIVKPLTQKDQWIVEQVGPTLRQKGLLFVGLDVIGDFLTEINVTSPTCMRELDEQCDLNIAAQFLDALALRLIHSC